MGTTTKPGQVLACIVKEPNMPFLKTVMGLMAAICDFDMSKLPGKGVLFVEGEGLYETLQQGNLLMVPSSLEAMEDGIALFESEKGPKNKRGTEGDPGVIIAFGSREFCQAFIHFMAMEKGGHCSNWGPRIIRQLSDFKPGDVLWRDLSKAESMCATTADLYGMVPDRPIRA